jgi:1,4-alpha-glucan branching enzyme
MPAGYLALVLHAHLPFVRHPEHDKPLEERWLHEAILECYLPLLAALGRLERDGIPVAFTMSLTPPLAAMLRDELLCRRFGEHLEALVVLVGREVTRLADDAYFGPVAGYYQQRLLDLQALWVALDGDLVGAFARHHEAGRIELLTCSATHAYLPGLLPCRPALRAQLQLGAAAFTHLVGHRPRGLWLPECAYEPSFDADIADAGLHFTVLDTHGLTHATPRPAFDVFHPVVSPAGVAFFARDDASSRQVWSREGGYPGNAYYRDFYRDIGFDLPESLLEGQLGPFGIRVMTGLKYHRITGKTDKKLPYMPGEASAQIARDAQDFVRRRRAHLGHLAATMPVPPVIVSPYDAELFGHWWFEGPEFLEQVFRALAPHRDIAPITLRAYLERHPAALETTPAASSWGAGGHGEVWVGPEAARFWRHVHHASREVTALVARYHDLDGPRGELLDLAIRELLLLQTSDWPFIIKTNSMVQYAEARLRSHTSRVRRLAQLVAAPSIEEADLTWARDLSARDSFLAGLPSATLRAAFGVHRRPQEP